MNYYKPVECQSLEKDEPEKEKEKLYPCHFWNLRNAVCNAVYRNELSPKFDYFKMNEKNYDYECKGLSNSKRCVSFQHENFSELDLKREEKHISTILKRNRSL